MSDEQVICNFLWKLINKAHDEIELWTFKGWRHYHGSPRLSFGFKYYTDGIIFRKEKRSCVVIIDDVEFPEFHEPSPVVEAADILWITLYKEHKEFNEELQRRKMAQVLDRLRNERLM